MQGMINYTPNPYFQTYMPSLLPDSYQNPIFNQNEPPMQMPIPDPGFPEINPPHEPAPLGEEAPPPVPVSPPDPVPAADPPAKPKHIRRSKNEKNGRDFICGCGKTYLSYPALYTHIKTKHGGKNPNGADQISSARGRGRPKKVKCYYNLGKSTKARKGGRNCRETYCC